MSESTAPSTMAEQGGTDHDGTTAMISNNGTEGDNKRKKMSMNFAVDEEGQPVGLPLDLFLFSTKKDSQEGLVRFTKTHRMPDTKLVRFELHLMHISCSSNNSKRKHCNLYRLQLTSTVNFQDKFHFLTTFI